jgi:NADH-quinone oxidoreductase subunit G
VVLENDLTRRASPDLCDRALDKAANIIALDCIETPITSRAGIVLPVPAYVEANGTFVNNEGRAQRSYQVFVPAHEPQPAWQTLQELAGGENWQGYEDVLRELADAVPVFAGALDAAPSADWRSPAGQKAARMPHRYSGRTSMHANVTMHEPQPPDDPDTPLAFSLQGDQNPVPGALEPRFWWPGWNSDNSVTKFQTEVNGPLQGGNPGKRLIEELRITKYEMRNAGQELLSDLEHCEVWLIPRPHIFGSEELSRFSEGIAELAPPVELRMNPSTASGLGLSDGDTVEFDNGGRVMRIDVRLDDGIADGVATVPAGYPETAGITSPRRTKIRRAE